MIGIHGAGVAGPPCCWSDWTFQRGSVHEHRAAIERAIRPELRCATHGSIPRTGSLPSQNIQQKQSGSRVPKTKSKRIDDEVRRRLGVDEQFQSTEPGERLAESWREANKDFFGPLRKSDFQPDQRFGKQLLCRSMRAEI